MSFNSKLKENERIFDIAKWALVGLFLIIAIVGNYYFRQYSTILRTIAVVFMALFSVGLVLWTKKGKEILGFIQAAKIEIRKVIWPSRQETLQTTLVVALVTIVMSLILWGLDGIMVRLVSFIIGLRF
ncbi:preprotein translocase subunit SecE [Arsenophonus symbiont of Ornithomya chloropus]|uniref:preprotein translocase subunit SecE n=1 Tax=Arsenophonus symbiont of Ornithomya chloropus TaxID=634121 RepID=UPI0032B16872